MMMLIKTFWVILFGMVQFDVGIAQQQLGINGILRLISNSNDEAEFCIAYPSQYYQLPDITPATPVLKNYNLINLTDTNICESGISIPKSSNSLLLMRSTSNCSLLEYIDFAANNMSASGIILITSSLKELNMLNQTYGLELVAAIGQITGDRVLAFWSGKNLTSVGVFSVDDDMGFEGSIILLWAVACFCVVVGSITGPYQDFQSSRQQILETNDNSQNSSNLQINFSVQWVLTLVVFISGTLLLLYFFYSYLVYFFMAVFCIASGKATYEILGQIVKICRLDHAVPQIKGYGLHLIAIGAISIALPITWFVFRHNPYIWILQDILGVCFCIHLIQTLRIPNLKIITVLLSLLFFYDIFFVFITPFLTPDGKSIMVEVATGGGSDESLPLLIKLPHLRSNPLAACSQNGFSLLGFGDIIIPGFLVCFAYTFDVVRGDKFRPYFITAVIGYAAGLGIAFVALYLSQTGQPALLYIVPATLIPVHIVGMYRKQVGDLWKGAVSIVEVEP